MFLEFLEFVEFVVIITQETPYTQNTNYVIDYNMSQAALSMWLWPQCSKPYALSLVPFAIWNIMVLSILTT
jgi:hypothetical protein